jgi:hypothetical protein
MVATNLHADTFEQARRQICETNPVSETALRGVGLMFFLAVQRSGWDASRRIDTLWASNGVDEHRQIFDSRSPSLHAHFDMVAPGRLAWARRTIDELRSEDARTIGQVRSVVIKSFERLA